VEIVTELPLSAVGKVLKYQLRERAAALFSAR
jgi:acyl-CoA synthetase (AMP-forming)/AMP-acid ligase II